MPVQPGVGERPPMAAAPARPAARPAGVPRRSRFDDAQVVLHSELAEHLATWKVRPKPRCTR